METTDINQKRVFIDLKPIIKAPSLFKIAFTLRSDGKTTGATLAALDSHDESGKAAVFCRRFSTEMGQEFYDEFIQNVKNARPDFLKGRDFDFIKQTRDKCGALMLQPRDGGEKRRAVTFLPLSKIGRLKSSFGYETHQNIYVDEYIPLDGRYTKNEVSNILELYKTVDRERYENYVLVLGNTITPDNPIFEYFGIRRAKRGLTTLQNGALTLYLGANAANVRAAKEGVWGDLVRGTAYEEYNEGGFLIDKYADMIAPTHTRALILRVAHGGRLYGIYAAGAAICADVLHDGAPPSLTVCVENQPAKFSAVWLDAAPRGVRDTLARFKYSNAFFFASHDVARALTKFYNAI